MLEIIYRIYQVKDREYFEERCENREDADCLSFSYDSKIEILMDCIACDSRDQFKDIIRDRYGDNIAFRYSKKLKVGDLYCVIIGEHCWNTERYFNKIEYTCDKCGAKITTYLNDKNILRIDPWEIRNKFYGNETNDSGKRYDELKFCSLKCLNSYIEDERNRIKPTEEQEFWVTKDMFTQNNTNGYIYKITKKSTGEFYVGQTQYIPVFRWAQHLKTYRFPSSNITDYKFEVIEIVPKGENLLDRETYWIQKCYKENPEKSLNISQTATAKKELLEHEQE